MSNLDHIFLYTILFAVFFYITRIKQKTINNHYWLLLIIPIILYSIILGCRYGWGNDYFWYKSRFEHPYKYKYEDPGFLLINLFINGSVGNNYVFAFILYSLIFITCAFVWIKDYIGNKYMLALFLPATLLLSTFTIRQSLGHSFIFLGLHFFQNKRWLPMLLSLLVAYSIHPAAILLVIPMLLLYYLANKPFPWKITIPIYTIASLSSDFINSFITKVFSLYLPLLTIGNKFDSYLRTFWFNKKAIRVAWEQGFLTLFLSMMFHIGIIYIGYVALKYVPQKKVLYVYNTVVIGLIATRIFWYFEIFRRISEAFVQLYFIPLGYAIYVIARINNNMEEKEWISYFVSFAFVVVYLVLYFGRFILLSPDYIFIWNN